MKMKNIVYAVAALLLFVQNGYSQLTRSIDSVSALDVTDKINVILIKSDSSRLVIEGELANQVEVVQTDDILRLKMTAGYIMKGNKSTVTVYTSNISSITGRKGAIIDGGEFELVGDSIYLAANEGAKLTLKVKADHVEAYSTAGGVITLAGTASRQNVNCTFGGSYFAKELKTDKAVARTNAGGRCELYVQQSVDVQTRAGGVIEVSGNPTDRTQKKLAGGRISFL